MSNLGITQTGTARREVLNTLQSAVELLKGWTNPAYSVGYTALRVANENAYNEGDQTRHRYEALGFVEGVRQALQATGGGSPSGHPLDALLDALSLARDCLRTNSLNDLKYVLDRELPPTLAALKELQDA